MHSKEAAACSNRAARVRTRRSRLSALLIGVALATAALAFSAAPALATSTATLFVVANGGSTSTSTCQSGAPPCALAWALTQATSGTTYSGDNVVISLGSGTYNTSSGYAITGGALNQLTFQGASGHPGDTVLDGDASATALTVDATYQVSVAEVMLQNGGGAGPGADLLDTGAGAVTVNDDVVSGGLTSTANNGTTGLVEATAGSLFVTNTTVEAGASGMNGVESSGGAEVEVEDSTITGETYGIEATGSAPFTVTDSTLDDNEIGVGDNATGVVTVTDSTISASGGAGIGIILNTSVIELGGNILANPAASGDCAHLGGTVDDLGYNVTVTDDTTNTCGFGTADGDTVASLSAIGLLSLGSNGGPTQTQQITSASAAYDTVPASASDLCGADTDDQRGVARLQPGASSCDAGAYQVAQPKITTSSLPSAEVGQPYSQTLAAGGGKSPLAFSITAGALPAGLTLSSSGTISGTPTSVSSSAFTVEVTDSYGSSSTASLSLSVSAAPVTTPVTPPVMAPARTPAVKIESTSIKLQGKSGKVKLACSTATCAGKIEIVKTVREKVKKGKKTVEETKTLVLASGSYKLAAGKTGSFVIKLNAIGRKDLRPSAAKPLHETLLATVTGGRTERRTVKLT
jgi:large repetitive protein